MIRAMGSCCSECGKEFNPDDLVVHHTSFEDGKTLGYQSPVRNAEIRECIRSGKIPEGSKLLCDSCNRKKHKYRPSKRDIFCDRLQKFDRSARTGEYYKTYTEQKGEHDGQIILKVERLKEENVGKDIEFLTFPPIPDILQVDWEKRELTAWELSRVNQFSEKSRKYKNSHVLDHVILTQVEKGKEKKSTFLWRRFRHRKTLHRPSKEVITKDGNNKSAKI